MASKRTTPGAMGREDGGCSYLSSPSRRTVAAACLVALLLTLAAIAAIPAGAAAPGKYKLTHFKVEVKGIQRTTQTSHHKPADACDVSDNSSITEKVVFKSTPKLMTFYGYPGELNPVVLFDQPGRWLTAATVTRHYTPRVVTPTPSPECGEADGGEIIPALPDCGTKKVSNWEVELAYDKHRQDGLYIAGGDHEDPFSDCPAPLGDLGFPALILEDTGGKPIMTSLPQSELFDPGIGKLIGLAGGTLKVEEPDVSAKVSIEWDVSLTRVGGVKTN